MTFSELLKNMRNSKSTYNQCALHTIRLQAALGWGEDWVLSCFPCSHQGKSLALLMHDRPEEEIRLRKGCLQEGCLAI